MSQSLILFRGSGKIEYQYNNKVGPFNEFISHMVNGTDIELEPDFHTQSINQKRFYSFSKEHVYAAIYFDLVTTIDREKIKHTLAGMIKIFNKISNEEYSKEEMQQKLKKLLDFQFLQLMKFKTREQQLPTKESLESSTEASGTTHVTGKANPKLSKKMRKWDSSGIVEVESSKVLDYSEQNEEQEDVSHGTQNLANNSAFVHENELVLVSELNELLDNGSDSDSQEPSEELDSKAKGFFSKFSQYFGSSVNLDDVSKKFNEQLISKNIAPPTAETIITRIERKLENKKGVNMNIYRQALFEELTKILTPNVSTDLLYDIKRSHTTSRPYVISIVGVNGVGKSTNLAKLAYWFLQNNLSVLICACDTFRSGAVEQLKVHVNNLKKLNNSSNSKIDIFEKGYGGGDHVVATAKLAIQLASAENYDVVLIDTAGRTHSNAKLMAPLKKFGDAANPDKIIMVGEALVGTDSVEQAINFNNAFGNKRNLDFFIISKVDTVGDLVGSMINMVMATKVPVLFVGTGQTYTDIKRLSVNKVVDLLMK
ncbi:uncharacterized protein PRCAT00000331001 [Priceomyces carsonii]|uniref:uncharacterized protein n=1 Tax=Priceomyces carsonii TaxID=28549 RepID=UPI002ED9E2A7|nr:unnamed protein product [Priceomyces carsonii]